MNVFQFFIIYKRTNNANNATHYVKLGKKRRESSKRNCYIISPRVIIKAIIIIQIHTHKYAHTYKYVCWHVYMYVCISSSSSNSLPSTLYVCISMYIYIHMENDMVYGIYICKWMWMCVYRTTDYWYVVSWTCTYEGTRTHACACTHTHTCVFVCCLRGWLRMCAYFVFQVPI